MVMSSRSALFCIESGCRRVPPPPLWCPFVEGLICRSVHYYSSPSEEGSCAFKNKPHFALAKGSSQCLVECFIVGDRAPSDLCGGYSVEAGGSLPATIAIKTSHQQVPRCHVTPGSCLRSPSTGVPPSYLFARSCIPQKP